MNKILKFICIFSMMLSCIAPTNLLASGIQPLDMIGDDGGTGSDICNGIHVNNVTHTATSGTKKHVYRGTANDITQRYYVGNQAIIDITVTCTNSMVLINYGTANGPVGLLTGTGGYVNGQYTLHASIPSPYKYVYIQYKGASSSSVARVNSFVVS